MAQLVPLDWLLYESAVVAVFAILWLMKVAQVRGNPIASVAIKSASKKGEGRMAMVHYPSGQLKCFVPELLDFMGNVAPYWKIGGVLKFKDQTGEKWETCGPLKVIHYTQNCAEPIATRAAAAIDQLMDVIRKAGFNPSGLGIKDTYYLIRCAEKGKKFEEIWPELDAEDERARDQLKAIYSHIKMNYDEIRKQQLENAPFTYQTAVSAVDQIIAQTSIAISRMEKFIEDRLRRKLENRFDTLMKYALIAACIIIPSCIGGVVFLVGGGFLK